MCKIKIELPVIPEGATDNERRKIMFDYLSSLDLSEVTEKREKLTYLSWANCLSILKKVYPDATYRVIQNENGLPYFTDPSTGIMVLTEVTVNGITTQCFLPVMDYRNQAMRLAPYKYQVWDKSKNAYIDKNVDAATMFDINKTIWRCLVKNVATATGIGLYLYQGEDIPEKHDDAGGNQARPANQSAPQQKASASKPQQQTTAPQPQSKEQIEELKSRINAATETSALVTLYLENTALIEGNAEVKRLITDRKKALNALNS